MLYSKIVGTTFTKSDDYLKTLSKGTKLELVPEPENKYDPNAVMVKHNGIHLGYIPKDTAPTILKMNNPEAYVSEITGGTEEKKNVGCNLEIYNEGEKTDGGIIASI